MKGRLAIRLCAKYCSKVFRTAEQCASAASGVSPMQVAAAVDGAGLQPLFPACPASKSVTISSSSTEGGAGLIFRMYARVLPARSRKRQPPLQPGQPQERREKGVCGGHKGTGRPPVLTAAPRRWPPGLGPKPALRSSDCRAPGPKSSHPEQRPPGRLPRLKKDRTYERQTRINCVAIRTGR